MTVGMLFVVLAASLEVTPLVGDHAVMQQGQPIPVWGTADGGALVTVEWTDAGGDVEVARTTVSDDGSWSVVLAARDWSADPATIRVTNGDVTWNAEDVLVGEVWIASGQSNMEWPVSRSNAKGDSAEAMTHAHVREFKVPHAFADVPQSTIHGQWAVAGPEATPKFSAVAWHFARGLNQGLGMPVGSVNSSWGGSRVEPWMSLDALDALRAAWQSILAARLETVLAARTLAGEERQFNVGIRTSTDVLDAASRLADAQSREVRSLADYEIALVDISFASGTLLGHSRVRFDKTQQRFYEGE